MAILRTKSVSKNISTTAIPLSATDLWCRQFTILNIGTNEVYLGGSDVTDSIGFPVAANSSLALDPNNAANGGVQQINLKNVYAICSAAESATLKILYLVEESE